MTIINWKPISSAPWGREVLVRGKSGYIKPHDIFIINAYRERDWHQGGWNNATGTPLSDYGWEPTEWAEIPGSMSEAVGQEAALVDEFLREYEVEAALCALRRVYTEACLYETQPEVIDEDLARKHDQALNDIIKIVESVTGPDALGRPKPATDF